MVLSEFAGAAQSLNGSIIVNPWNTEELSNAIYEAVTMSEDVRKANHQKLYRYVTKYTAAFWGLSFIKELQRLTDESTIKKVPRLPNEKVVSVFRQAKKKKVFLLDYDGTLTALQNMLEFATPSKSLLDLLKKLASMPDVFVYILSGRPRQFLDKWFGETGVGLCAEHGCFYKHPSNYKGYGQQHESGDMLSIPREVDKKMDSDWFALVDQVDTAWRSTIEPLFQHYTERTPGSFIEQKEMNLTWHYRNADPEFGIWQATELQVNLEKILSHLPVSVFTS